MMRIYNIYSVFYKNFAHLDKFFPHGRSSVVFDKDQIDPNNSIVIFHGGGDIHPSFYNQKPNYFNDAFIRDRRDKEESVILDYCIDKGVYIFGICRGAQWLCIKAGGTLIQHVVGHGSGYHTITLENGEEIPTNSYHHQLQNIFKLNEEDYKLLGWTKISDVYLGEESKKIPEMQDKVEPEIVYYPKIKGFAVQGHPEWSEHNSPLVLYTTQKFKELCDIE